MENEDTTVEYLVAQSIQVLAILRQVFMTTHKWTVDFQSRKFWTGTESRVSPPQLKENKQIDALTVLDSRSQEFGVTAEADGCTTDDKVFQQACSTGKLVDKDYAINVDLTAGERTNELKAKLVDLLNEFRDVFASTDSELGATNQVYHQIDTGEIPPVK